MIPAIPESAACRASVVIATHNRQRDLEECLASLAAQPLEPHATEVIVIDDASTDGTVTELSACFPEVRWLRNETNGGPAASRNRAAGEARGDVLLFLDSDGVVTEGWLERMLAHHDGGTVLLGCAVDYDGGRVQGLPRRATFLGKSLRCAPHRANTGPSCNLGVPKAAFDAIGGFDEDIPYYFEDSDLCIRLRKAGARFVYVEDAIFRHKGDERKKGEAIRMQEHNSVFAMLKAYRGNPLKLAAFTLANGLWLVLRLILWTLRGRVSDAARLWRGWRSAYARFASTGTRSHSASPNQ